MSSKLTNASSGLVTLGDFGARGGLSVYGGQFKFGGASRAT